MWYRYRGKTNLELRHNQLVQVIFMTTDDVKFLNPRTSKTQKFSKKLFDKYFTQTTNDIRV